MNNLNKYTKAELINKFREIESKIDSDNKSMIKISLFKFLGYILLFKNFFIKITLITLLIKYFKRFRILRRLWLILNTVVMSIFGISLIDNFGLEFITSFLNEIRNITYSIIDYLSNTKFYIMLTELFSNKIETPTKQKEIKPRDGSLIKEISSKTIKSETIIEPNKGNSKISDWLKPEEEITNEVKSDETSYKKYYIIVGIIIVSSLCWHYSDEIKTTAISLYDWINSFRSNPSNPGGDNSSNSTTSSNTPIQANIPGSRPINSGDSDIVLSDLSEKGKLLHSPSLEALNEQVKDHWGEASSSTSPLSKSPTSEASGSSTETITPQSYMKSLTSEFESSKVKLDDSLIERIVDKDWKTLVHSNIKDSIEYVETHFPKSDIDDSSYIQKLINDVKQENINYAKDIKSKISSLSVTDLRYSNALAQKTDLWIEAMEEKLRNLE